MYMDSNIYYRVKLLKRFSELKMSESTGEIITAPILKAPEDLKESLAESVVKKMENCTTEEEIVQVLELE